MTWKRYCDMTPEEKEHNKALHNEWVRKNPEKNTKYHKNYVERNREKYNEYHHEYYMAHREQLLEYAKRRRELRRAQKEAANDSV